MTPVQRVAANAVAAVLLAGYYYNTRVQQPGGETPSILLMLLTIAIAVVASIPASPAAVAQPTKVLKVKQSQ